MTVLAQGSIFEITVEDHVARCAVTNRPDVTPTDGASAAREMERILREQVIPATSPYRGLVFDVQQGPSVFGPDTRAALEKLFAEAESSRKPLAVLIGTTAMQRLQFSSLVHECAPHYGKVTERLEDAVAWIGKRPA